MKNIILLVMLIVSASNITTKAQYERNINKGSPVLISQPKSITPGDENWSDEFPGPPGVNAAINTIAIDTAGNLYAGGLFTVASGINANRIAKWDGSSWISLGTGLNNTVNAIAIDNSGFVYAGGTFTIAGDNPANYIAKWDGTSWSALGTGLNNTVNAITIDNNGNVYAGGSFTTAGGVSANKIAKWDGTSWSALGTGLNNTVNALAINSIGNLYTGGLFTTAGDSSASRIASWDGASWSAVGTGVNNTVNTLAFDSSGNVYAGGDFTIAGGVSVGKIAKWDGTDWSELEFGMNNSVKTLAIDSYGIVYAGGLFTFAGSVVANRIAQWDGFTWSEIETGMNNSVNSIVLDNSGNMHAGGGFTTAGTIPVSRIVKWNGTWSSLGTGFNNLVNTIEIDDNGNIYIGGGFLVADDIYSNRITKWNGTTWSSMGLGLNNTANAISSDGNGNIYVAGVFTLAGGVSASKVAKWDGSSWYALGTGVNSTVNAIAIDNNGNVYVGGVFTIAGGISASKIAKWDGSSWTALGTGLNNTVNTLSFDKNGNLYAGGTFTTAGGISANRIAKWDGISWSALGTGVDNIVNEIAIDNNGNLYAGGTFTTAGGVSANRIAKWNGTIWTSLGTGVNNTVNTITIDDNGFVFIGGTFTTADIISANRIAKWNGTNWTNLGSGTNGAINIIKTFENFVYCGGNFLTAGDKNSAYFAKYIYYPEINIIGNSNSISNGDNTPDLTDHTDFGSSNIATPVTRTFTIENTGDGILYLNDSNRIIITGRGFSLVDDSISSVNSNSSKPFQVSFTPDSCGLFTGLIYIANNDTNENPYSFAISGIGIDNIPPVSPTLIDVSSECSVLSINAPTTTDNCVEIVTGTTSQTFPIMEQGTTIVTWLFEDENGNITIQTQNVIIDDITNPVLDSSSLPDITAECSVTLTAPTATDNCSGIIIGSTTQVFPITSQGITIVTWAFDDGNGNTSIQLQNVVIDDITSPVSDVTSLPDLTGECSATATAPTATDNCVETLTGTTTDLLTYDAQGNYSIIWIYDDGNGNTTSQTQNVIIDDISSPVSNITSLPDLTGECSATATAPTATDNCSGIITGTTTDPITYTVQGNYSILWNYDDGNGNTNSQTQNVVIDDITSPVSDVATLPDLTGECSATATAPTATDNCSGIITGITNTIFPITAQGTTVIFWTYDDGNGNITIQTQNVIINDITNPVPDVASLPDLSGECSVTAIVPTATDNCTGGITGTSNITFPITAQGTTVIFWTYDDGNGNTTSQTQNVVIDDITSPVSDIVSLPDLNGECSVTTTAPTATDNCSGVISGTTADPLTYSEQGNHTIIWTYDDGNGNTTTQTQNIIVADITHPVPNIATLPDLTGECSVTLSAPTATDNCVGIIIGTTTSISPITEYGITVVLWTFDDGYGNVTTSSQNIMITGISTNLNITACENYTLNDTTYYSSGIYTQILTNTAGCDSTITLNLTINNATTSTIIETACNSYTLNETTYNTSGIYFQNLVNSVGCDSILTLNLTINNSTSSYTAVTACGSYKWTNAITYTSSGIYVQYLENSSGCDSTATLDLIIHTEISVNLGADDTLCSNRNDIAVLDAGYEGMNYLWNDGSQLQTLTVNSEFMAIGDYVYSVTVTDNVCNDFDEIILKVEICTGIENSEIALDINIYPNPSSNGIFNIETTNSIRSYKNINVYDITGRKVFENITSEKNYKMDLSRFGAGVYTFVINNENNFITKRIIITENK